MRQGGVNSHIDHLTHQAHAVGAGWKVDHPVALGAASHFGGVFARWALYQNALHRVQATVANAFHIGFNGGLQMVQTLELDIMRCFILQVGRWGARTRTEDES